MNQNFECHITTTVEFAAIAEKIAAESGWKTSEIKRDPILGDGSHFYLTAHDKNFNNMFSRMKKAVDDLREAGCLVIREKIEEIIYDVRHIESHK